MTKQEIIGKVLQTYQIELTEDKAVLLSNNLNVLLKLIEDPEFKYKEVKVSDLFAVNVFEEMRDLLMSLLRQ